MEDGSSLTDLSVDWKHMLLLQLSTPFELRKIAWLWAAMLGKRKVQLSSKMNESSLMATRCRRLFCLLFTYVLISSSSVMKLAAGSKTKGNSSAVHVDVGVIFGREDWVGRMGLTCMQMALSDFYASHPHYNTRIRLHVRDSGQGAVGAAAAALYLMEKVKVKAIVGPVTSMEARFVIDLGAKAQVPIISYSATSPFLSYGQLPYFIRATQNDSGQVLAIGALMQAFGWREVVLIYMENEYGKGIIPDLVYNMQQINIHISNISVISPFANDDQILEELHRLKIMQTSVFVVHLLPDIGSKLFSNAKHVGMMSECYIWIVTNGISNILDSLDNSVIESMQGVLGVKTYVPKTKELDSFSNRWKVKFQEDNLDLPKNAKLNVLGLWAYDTASALARAAEELSDANFVLMGVNNSSNFTDLDNIKVSKAGPKLLRAISSTKFKGLSGEFNLVDGQLQSSTYQIINVIGHVGKEIGFWTLENGLTRDLNITSQPNSLKPNLHAIVWPGNVSSTPRGWVIPTGGMELRILVPRRPGFEEFVNVTQNSTTNATNVTGYCIDVFDKVMARLPYNISPTYFSFEVNNGSGSYDNMVYQVYLQKYDAIVGDVTIRANRSRYVDFTQPYTLSGLVMVVPVKDDNNKNALTFLKPLTWHLWVTTLCFFVFIAFVVWILEHRINEEFRGPPSHQAGTSLYYSFSVMVFAQRENIVSNLGRFVVIVWVFVVLILTQSYTASLTSMLTAQQLQPTATDLNELIKKGEYVGYQSGSFVEGLLHGLGVSDSKLRAYNNFRQLDELLSNGSSNGGIAAAVDTIPFMNLFLYNHCSKYTTIQLPYGTGGFGYVFPLGSPLLHDISKAIMDVTEGDEIREIEEKWIAKKKSCLNSSSVATTASLGLESFWGLFLIVGIASVLALSASTVMFLYKQKNIWMRADTSLWTKIQVLAKIFNQRDTEFPTFKKTEQQWSRHGNSPSIQTHCDDAVDTEPNTDYPPCPSAHSVNYAERNSMSLSDGVSPSPDRRLPFQICM
ncbi:hypothetical protein Nepgr_011078 [Nepenthes gracilis]|uniref:Ionotropic glutamate receptor C-terminal domain-containing protein n=1 Tax=Nepenthes gracilis TaxID=150966 RepID=A0AAD3XLM5_NEPGR|nr:hypothetical protein Nepgr_011078 [Nepenthes gracilis]